MIDNRSLHVGMVVTYDLSEHGGGVKQHALQLARALRNMGDTVTVFGPSTLPISTPDVQGFPGVVNVWSNGSGNRLGILASPFALWRFLRTQQFDLLHIHEPLTPSLPYYVSWLSPGVPRIATFHAYSEQSAPGLLAARRLFAPLILPWIHRGIAVSEAAFKHARIDYEGPLDIIPNGISAESFPPERARAPGGPLRLLFVGRTIDARKGFGYLLEAVTRARTEGLDVELHVVGERTPSAEKGLPAHVVHHGPLGDGDLAAQYRACDIFVAPSTGQESFGIVLLEAMSSGRPIICSDIYGYRQSANPRGTRWVPPRDADALHRAILELAERPEQRARFGDANARYVRRFDWSVVAPEVRAAYLRTIADATGVVVPERRPSQTDMQHARGAA
jgi:phosphatidyl-myo-inositol alpha-mannosyltransferase